MSRRNAGLTADPLFVGATRPPMRWGVTYSALLFNMVFTLEIFLLTRNLLMLLLCLPTHALCALLCTRDARIFDLLMLWGRTRLPALLANLRSGRPAAIARWHCVRRRAVADAADLAARRDAIPMSGLWRQRILRRELLAAERIPYTVQVSDSVVRTALLDYVQVFRLGGASFESADDEQLNNWHERLNILWRNIAGPGVALWAHIIRRREAHAVREVRISMVLQARCSTSTAIGSRMKRSWSTRSICAPSTVQRPVLRPELIGRALNRRQVVAARATQAAQAAGCLRQAGADSFRRHWRAMSRSPRDLSLGSIQLLSAA